MTVGNISRFVVWGSVAAAFVACSSDDQTGNTTEPPGGSSNTTEVAPVSPGGSTAVAPTAPNNTSVSPQVAPPVGPTATSVTPNVTPSVTPPTNTNVPVNPVNPVSPVNPGNPVSPDTSEPDPVAPDPSEPDNNTEPDPSTTGTPTGPVDPGTPTACTITVSSSQVAEKIPTVGIVEWSTDLASVTEAWIEFGKDTSYGLTAPVDLDEPNLRTLLLGMEASSTYNYRIVAKAGDQVCNGENQTIETGAVPNALLNLNVETSGTVAKGFTITSAYSATGHAYILNEAGNPVWFYAGVTEPTRARMSYDGKHMWIGAANVPRGRGAQMLRVAMDGSGEETLSAQFADMNHDFTVTPDESVIFIAYGANNGSCDDVRERTPDGQTRTIVNSGSAHGESGACHLNAIHYSAEDDTVVFSDLDHDNYTKVKRDTGETVWVLGGGGQNDFTGDGASWDNQHGFHLIGLDRILIFNNGVGGGGAFGGGGGGGGSGSHAIEIALDLDNLVATREWEYSSGLSNQIMGDAQRLSNGHTLVTYSYLGVIHEVDAEQNLVQSISSSGVGSAFGYAEKRESLYGPPPR